MAGFQAAPCDMVRMFTTIEDKRQASRDKSRTGEMTKAEIQRPKIELGSFAAPRLCACAFDRPAPTFAFFAAFCSIPAAPSRCNQMQPFATFCFFPAALGPLGILAVPPSAFLTPRTP
jgi:hypothetical protein